MTEVWTREQYGAYLAGGLPPSPLPQDAREEAEGAFLARVRRAALDHGWLFHHVRNSRGCDPGFPDVCCVKPGHAVLLAELKTARGKVTIEQTQWLDVLAHATGVESYLWRPKDWPMILTLLQASPSVKP